jgi:hypothetical protein
MKKSNSPQKKRSASVNANYAMYHQNLQLVRQNTRLKTLLADTERNMISGISTSLNALEKYKEFLNVRNHLVCNEESCY